MNVLKSLYLVDAITNRHNVIFCCLGYHPQADLPHTIGLTYFYRNWQPPLHMHGIIGPPDIYVSEIFSYISGMTIKKLSVS